MNEAHLKRTQNIMNKHKHHTEEIGSLAEDARALLQATAEVAGSKVAEARQRLNLALENAKELAAGVRSKAVAGARVTDKAIRQHPYKAIGIALGAGALVGCVLAGRQARKNA
jgi:ElaB/YqjD/DUF883 family membrane-anchored ribosome-binding protein